MIYTGLYKCEKVKKKIMYCLYMNNKIISVHRNDTFRLGAIIRKVGKEMIF